MYQIKGKIDSTNAPAFEKELLAALPTEIDASGLEYISSAGLRVLLKLAKTLLGFCKPPLEKCKP